MTRELTGQDAKRLVGQIEGATRKFKAAEILSKPVRVAEGVVAFLNAEGGEIWIGVNETDGVATSLGGIPNAVAARDALWNHIVETIEPSPLDNEVRIAPDSVEGVDLIHVWIRKSGRRPFALLRDRGRQFLVRAGARIRAMTREEIATQFRAGVAETDIDAAKRKSLESAIAKQLGSPVFWWQLVPSRSLAIDFEDIGDDDRRFFRELLTNPAASKNPPYGPTMISRYVEPTFGISGINQIPDSRAEKRSVQIATDGTMTFMTPIKRLLRADTADQIDPFTLIQIPVSSFRMAAKVLEKFADDRSNLTIALAAVIGKASGIRLRAGTPADQDPSDATRELPGKDLVVSPFTIAAEKIVENPDAAAYRLVHRIYEQFGFGSDAIPPEFDARDRVLRLKRT